MLVLELGATTYWQFLDAETWVRQFIIQTNKCATYIQGGSNMTGTDLYVNKPHCAAAVRP